MGVPNLYILAAFAAVIVCYAKPPAPEDIGTNFFLKASKSVPRIGRRTMEYENYFLKASKSIPRIGRRTVTGDNEDGWLSKDMPESAKRSFFEKYFKENEQPVWSDLERLYQDYPGPYQGEESFVEGRLHPKPDPYMARRKKNEEETMEEPQTRK